VRLVNERVAPFVIKISFPVSPLRNRNFRWFFLGYSTSMLGTGMAPVGIAFAVLDLGGSATSLGLVLTASVAMTVICLVFGGVLADRFGRRAVMLGSDIARCGVAAAFAAVVILGHPPISLLIGLSAAEGAATGFFSPALIALVPELIENEKLHDANILIGLANNVGNIVGPAVAGTLVLVSSAGVVIALDAASFAVSALSLAMLQLKRSEPSGGQSMLQDLRSGWNAWRSRSWLWITDFKFALFNAVVYAPLLVLGPTIAKSRLGGPGAWGLILAAEGAGAVIAGVGIAGRRLPRPLQVVMLAQALWALLLVALAVPLPVPVIAGAAFVAGAGSAATFTAWNTTLQRNIPNELLARVGSYDFLASFILGPIGLSLVGPIASEVGNADLLWFGASWQLLSTIVILCLPQIRRFQDKPAREFAVRTR
jgi:MFS family permease